MQPKAKDKSKERRSKRRRTEALRIRLTDVERAAVDAAAEMAGVGVCSFARVLIVGAVGQTPTPAPRRRREPSAPARDLAKVIGALGKIGNNVNQLARCANSGIGLDPALVKEAINELRKLRDAIVAAHDGGT